MPPIKNKITALLPPHLRDFLRIYIYRAETVARRPLFTEMDAPQKGWQILLGISFPASGTRLLNLTLLSFSEFAPFSHHIPLTFHAYDEETAELRSEEEALAYLNSLRPLDVSAARLPAWEAVVKKVCAPPFLPFFIYRDPRDIALSHAFALAQHLPEDHPYPKTLQSLEERLSVSIAGLPETEENNEIFPNFSERFSPYLGWLDQPNVLAISFEAFIQDRRGTQGKIFDHIAKDIPDLIEKKEEALDVLAEKTISQGPPLFRAEESDLWKKYFTDEHKALFKDTAGDLLLRLGYEKDQNW